MNIQYAIKDDVVYVIEVNPRASRTTPFVSKATGVPLAKVAARVIAGRSLAEQGLTEDLRFAHLHEGVGLPLPQVHGQRHPARAPR